jgi:predicted Zn-dependent protease
MAETASRPVTETRGVNRRLLAIVLAGMAILGVGGFFFWQWQVQQDRKEREEALRLAEKGDFARAEPLLLRQAGSHPSDPAIAKELALGYLRAGRLADAEPFFNRWCEANPNDTEAYAQRIAMWIKWDRLPNAVNDARQVLTLQPDNRKLHQHLTHWILSESKPEEAEQECQQFLHRWPGDPWVLLVLARAYQKMDRPKEAIAIVDQLIRDIPEFPEAYVLRGDLYCEANQPKEAIPLLRRAAAIQGPHRRQALYLLGPALLQTGQNQEAEEVMKEARLLQEQEFLSLMTREFGTTNFSAQARLAEEQLNAGKTEEGLRLLDRLLEMDPNCAVAHRVLADYYDKHGQPERAAEHRHPQGSTP